MIENESLVEMIQNGVDVQDNMLRLYKQNQGFIQNQIRRYKGIVEYDDLMQEAFIALYNAVSGFRPEKETTFLTYYGNNIQWTILSYMRQIQNVSLPNNLLQDINRYKTYIAEYSATHGTEPDEITLMDSLDIDQAHLKRIRTAIERLSPVSLNKSVTDEDETELIDLIPGENNTEQIEEVYDQELRRKIIRDQIRQLPQRQQDIIDLSYYKELKADQIADILNCDIGEIRYGKTDAIKRLRKGIFEINRTTKLFQEYERMTARVFSNHGFRTTQTSTTEYIAMELLNIEKEIQRIKEIKHENRGDQEQHQENLSELRQGLRDSV